MRIIKLSATIISIGLFLIGCNTNQPPQTANVAPTPPDATLTEVMPEDDYWAKDNLDLPRVGNLLERSNSPQEFESYLNSRDGINNLDLNGDGYVDYISVDEYQDRDDNSRGLSLFSRFGPGLIQEIAQIVLYRDRFDSPGSRVLLIGNDQIYGDNRYYETNWTDRSLGIVSPLFGNHDYYRSPYYYDNYPSGYQVYQVVETPYYRTHIEQIYPQPLFIYTTNPTFITKIKIKSPNNGLHLGQIKARLVKPTKEQAEFFKNNPGRPGKVDKVEKVDKGGKKDDSPGSDNHPKGNPNVEKEKVQPPKAAKAENPKGKSPNPDKGGGQNKGKGKGKP